MPITREPSETNAPPPLAILFSEAVTVASLSVAGTEVKDALGPAPAAFILIAPLPLLTWNRLAVPLSVHGPPDPALPKPLVTVRPKSSSAKTPSGGGLIAVTEWDTVSVPPRSSVTVRVTL